MNLILIAGARPNFMKIAPLVHAIKEAQNEGKSIRYRLVHTGQHYDRKMSETFFRELNIPEPDVNLGCGGGTQAEQTAAIMIAFEKDLLAHPADLVVVVGDVTSTMACSIVAKKLHTKVAHVEAGIRSWDLTMPEEINRMVTDCLADYFFTTTPGADRNLRNAGIPGERIFRVGNVMIDTLLAHRQRFRKPEAWDTLGLKEKEYLVMTLHRPANVDEGEKLRLLIREIVDHVNGLPVIFPVHPRTATILNKLFTKVTTQHEESTTMRGNAGAEAASRPQPEFLFFPDL
jgi:UDP-N-acetylglucosamine 2-epimerase (non-hydrolysing)